MLKNFIYEEDGMGTIEIAILVAALVALAIVFRKQLADLWGNISGTISDETEKAKLGDFSDGTGEKGYGYGWGDFSVKPAEQK